MQGNGRVHQIPSISYAENLKSCDRGMLFDFCNVCFLQCLHKHGEANFRNGMIASAFQNCPKKKKLNGTSDGSIPYSALLHGKESRLVVMQSR